MSDLISPKTGLPIHQENLLKELLIWSTHPPIVKVILAHGIVSRIQLFRLIGLIMNTLEQIQPSLKDDETAVLALGLLKNRDVRIQIAKESAKRNKKDKKLVMKDLWSMREWLEEHYQVTEEGSKYAKTDIRRTQIES